MLVLATIGGTIFTLAPTWPMLLTGRVLMGAGFGAMLIGSMVVISRWFPPDRFSTLTAMVLSIGLLGNLAATTPLAWASQAIGWRSRVRRRRGLHRARHHRRLAGGARRAAGHPFLARTPSHHARCCKACWRCCATRACGRSWR
jgi:MFS family permease